MVSFAGMEKLEKGTSLRRRRNVGPGTGNDASVLDMKTLEYLGNVQMGWSRKHLDMWLWNSGKIRETKPWPNTTYYHSHNCCAPH